jgi:hypothetical protein
MTPLPADHRFAETVEPGAPTWVVQTGELGKGAGNDYGVVSDGLGFEDSPDCEWISGGINSKGPHALAIGREANFLQWGFYAAPDRMTESARRAFLNALVYVRQFDGQRPLVQKAASSRSWMDRYLRGLRKALADDGSAGLRTYYFSLFPDEVVAATEGDPERLAAWVDEVREYLYQEGGRRFLVDEDLRGLGLSNRRPEFLDWLRDALAEDPSDPRALRLAKRYLGEAGRDAASARAWIDRNRERAFFSDLGGYRWFVDPRAR